MTEATSQKQTPPFAVQAARASIFAPVIAVLLNMLTSAQTEGPRVVRVAIGITCSLLILTGFVCAVIGLANIRKHGRKGILVRSVVGLLINGIAIAGAVYSIPVTRRLQEQMSKPRFTITPPPGFAAFPPGMQEPNVLYSYVKGDLTDQVPDIVCLVEQLGGTIGQGDDLGAFLASRPDITLLKESWKGYNIDVFRVPQDVQGAEVLTLNAQIPLLPRAIQVKIMGLVEREEELRQDLRAVLNGIDGPSNW
jgi:hypothetical protein